MNQLPKTAPGMYRLIIIHYLISGLCFALLAVLLLLLSGDFPQHYFAPGTLAITHLAALGWGTLIIFGACYQLLPVLLECELFSIRLPWIILALFLPGLFCLVFSLWTFDPGLHMQVGGLLLSTSVILFCILVYKTASRSHIHSAYKDFILTSCIWLLATVILGTLLVFNFQYGFLPKDHLHFLRLHAHMGIAGWFLMLIIGVSAKLIPMFLVSRDQPAHLLSWSYYLINLSLILFIVDAYLNGLSAHTQLILLPMLAGLGCYFVYVRRCFRSRLKKKLDIPILKTALSIFFLSLALLLLPAIIHYAGVSNAWSVKLSSLYGMLIFMGWITALIMGQTFKTLPFIVWVKKYEHLSGKAKIPMPADLYQPRLLQLQYIAYLAFCLTFFTGFLLSYSTLMIIGAVCIIVAACAYLGNVIILITHKTTIKP
ncbi:MAG: hypothetical protein ACO1NU_14635 [Arcticibacter sp.]